LKHTSRLGIATLLMVISATSFSPALSQPDRASALNREVIASRYEQCMKNAAVSYQDFPIERHKTFCTCVSQRYTDMYVSAADSIRRQTQITMRASMICGSRQFLRDREAQRKKRLEDQKSDR